MLSLGRQLSINYIRAIGAAIAQLLYTEKATGLNPVSPILTVYRTSKYGFPYFACREKRRIIHTWKTLLLF